MKYGFHYRSVEYLPPENIPPVSVPASEATDIYSYGICLVKVLDKKYVRSPSTGSSHVPDENQKALDESENRSLVSLITALLSPDAHVRPTASEALYSDFFTSAELLSHKSVFEDEFNEIRSRGKGDDEERQEGDAPFDRDFITIQAARDRSCSLCGSTVDMLQGVTCSDKHFTCSTCVESHLLSYLQTDVLSARSILLFDKATKKEVCVSRTPHEIIAALSLCRATHGQICTLSVSLLM